MSAPFADGLRTRVVFTGDTKAAIIDQVRQTLVDVGWSGLAADEYHDSGITPQGLQCRVRIHDNGGACAVIQFRNNNGAEGSETQIGAQHFLLPKAAPTEYCIIANKYQFFVFVINQPMQPRTYVGGGVLHMDPPLYTPTRFLTESIWSNGNGRNDGDVTTGISSFRNDPSAAAYSWNETNGIYSVTYSFGGGNPRSGAQTLLVRQAHSTKTAGTANRTGYIHHMGQSNKIRARMMWGRIDSDGEPPGSFRRIMGTLWDVVIINSNPAAPILCDALDEFDGYKWHNITDPTAFATPPPGSPCIFIAYEAVVP